MATGPNKLPKKDYDTFTEIVKCYENKQYSKGLKLADGILKKHPEHGETLAMKGLILNFLGRKEKAYEFVKNGLKNDLKSSVCWHVYGLVQKSDNNFKEAIKCYLNALKFDPESQLILKDLSFLQLQMRDINGFIDTRGKILNYRPTQRASWVAFALADYLGKNYQSAYDSISKYNESIGDRGDEYEESELLLFQNKCLEDDNRYDAALEHLSKQESKIVDKNSIRIKRAQILLYLGRYDEALTKWTDLVKDQVENYSHHAGLQSVILRLEGSLAKELLSKRSLNLPSNSLILSSEQKEAIRSYYELLSFPGRSIDRILLDLQDDNTLREALEKYLMKQLDSGIPALYEDISALIRIPIPSLSNQPQRCVMAKDPIDISRHPMTTMLFEILDGYIDNLSKYGTFNSSSSIDLANPQAILWTKYLKCQLLDMSGQYMMALNVIDECIDHTPTGLDMYIKKSEILKHLGQHQLAASVMDYCRSLDLQDRYLNNKATEYLLQTNRIDDGMTTIALFTKHDGDPEQSLTDLQCSWYEIELGDAYARTKQYGKSLKKYYSILTHFHDFLEDMFDFHGYCIRKSTLRAYTDVLQAQDKQYSHHYFQRAYSGAISVLLHLLDHPEEIPPPVSLTVTNTAAADDTPVETSSTTKTKKSAPSSSSITTKGKKESQNKENEEKDEEDEVVKAKDDDPYGDKYLRKDFLVEANVWSSHLDNILNLVSPEVIALYAEVKGRRSEYMKMIDALSIGLDKYPNHPSLIHSLIVLTIRYLDGFTNQPSVANHEEVIRKWKEVLNNREIDEYLDYLQLETNNISSKSFPLIISVTQGRVELWNSRSKTDDAQCNVEREAWMDSIVSVMQHGVIAGVSASYISKSLKFVREAFDEKNIVRFITSAKEIYPDHDEWKTTEELLQASMAINSDPEYMKNSVNHESDGVDQENGAQDPSSDESRTAVPLIAPEEERLA